MQSPAVPATILQQTEFRDRYIQMDWSHLPLIIHQAPAFLLCFDSLCVYCSATVELKKSIMDSSLINLIVF